ncbi:DeoR family transcriptional regulator [Alkalihalobacillus sp. AL-G]|uniref:DeoR family transcriptional regulator n=1 Tax=Alkalihalobacillus sp. AL-G TaxID=2926399 RepID=UPI00272C2236|nr:DeoR family transcriptional regulator [Alkalihalobacillus sp. AL-G]WLD94519.1 DeoR family transcriptional regulator [Alkalihalobacillus sp. AL-G]
MLPVERIDKIRELIKSQGKLKTSELSEMLGVSEMTIHRDINALVTEGLVVKTYGGLALAKDKADDISAGNMCTYCSREVLGRYAYRLVLSNDQVESTCCAHCGLLRHRQLGDHVIQAICYDFFIHTAVSVKLAWFVMDTTIDIGCCQPQVITFSKKEYADGFVKGFGGIISTFDEAKEKVAEKMNGTSCCQ